MPLKDFPSPVEWALDLDARWPKRTQLRDELMRVISAEAAARPGLSVLELGIGDGALLETFSATTGVDQIAGIDLQPALIDFVQARVPAATLHTQDLTKPEWPDVLGQEVDVVYSLQSFHDLGGRAELADTYRRILFALAPGGLLLNADFTEPQAHDDPAAPRRFPAEFHLSLLEQIGFTDCQCTLDVGDMACISARHP